MKKTVYLGIDPGSVTGCIAIIGEDFHDTIEFSKLTTREWYDLLKEYTDSEDFTIGGCLLERVHGLPGTNVVAVSSFMKNVGHIEMALLALNIPFIEVTPQSWMKRYGMKRNKDESKTEWKRRLRELLQRLKPDIKVTNDIADAILLALYAKELSNGSKF